MLLRHRTARPKLVRPLAWAGSVLLTLGLSLGQAVPASADTPPPGWSPMSGLSPCSLAEASPTSGNAFSDWESYDGRPCRDGAAAPTRVRWSFHGRTVCDLPLTPDPLDPPQGVAATCNTTLSRETGGSYFRVDFDNGYTTWAPAGPYVAPRPAGRKPKPVDPFRDCQKPTAMQRTVICTPRTYVPGNLIVRDSRQRTILTAMRPVASDSSTLTNFPPGRYVATITPNNGRSKCTTATFTVTKTSRSLVKITCRR